MTFDVAQKALNLARLALIQFRLLGQQREDDQASSIQMLAHVAKEKNSVLLETVKTRIIMENLLVIAL